MAKNFEITGLKELLIRLENFDKTKSKKAVKNGLMQTAKFVKNEAKKIAPHDTGEMKNHLSALSSKTKDKNIIKTAVLVRRIRKISLKTHSKIKNAKLKAKFTKFSDNKAKSYVYYAHFLEYGTKKMSAKPFLSVAVEKGESFMSQAVMKELEIAIREFNR